MNAILNDPGTHSQRCGVCGTTLRPGQPHSSLRPTAHQSMDMLTVTLPADFEARAEAADKARMEVLARRRKVTH